MMAKGIYVLMSRKKGKGRFRNAGPYSFSKKSDFGSLARLKKSYPELDLKIVKRKRK